MFSDFKPHVLGVADNAAAPAADLGTAGTRAFRTPSLRNVAGRAPYMHAGQFATLADVINHYNRAPAAPAGHSELAPLGLNAQERRQIEAFLRSLSAP